MRRNLWLGCSSFFCALFLSASALHATSIPIKGGSSYGSDPAGYGSTNGSFTGGSFTESTICPTPLDLGSSCTLAYVYNFMLTPPAGSTSFTLDFPTATSGVSLSLLFCDAPTTIPCGTLSGDPISGTLGPDGGIGQQFTFTDLSQLQNQKISLIFVDSSPTTILDENGDPVTVSPNVPQFSASWGTGPVATPEPASLSLLGIGVLALGAKLRRKAS